MPDKKITIKKKYLILCEGLDEFNFLTHYLNCPVHVSDKRYANDIQVFNFGGNEELKKYLMLLKNTDGFSEVESLLVIRDAERNAERAVVQIQQALREAGLVVPEGVCIWERGKPDIGFLLFPTCSSTMKNGTLEDLCLQILKEEKSDMVLNEIDGFMTLLQERYNRTFPHEFKTKLHTYFSVTDNYVSLKIGEAAKAGAFDWNSNKLLPLRDFIRAGFV